MYRNLKLNMLESGVFLIYIFLFQFFLHFSVEELRYICEVCNKVFSRKVTLKKHREQHEEESGMEFGESDEEIVIPRKRTKVVRNITVEEYPAETDNNTIFLVNDN